MGRRHPGHRGQILSFEAWQQAAGVDHVLPTWQLVRTASMWRECNAQPFEVPPFRLWPGMVKTLRFIRDHVVPAVGPVEAVSGYRNPALNACARGSERSAHLDFFALDLVPLRPTTRRQLFEEICPMHSRDGPAAGVGLGFYTFTRFHIDTRSFRRWGTAGPAGNESPCAVLERGGDPEAPPLPPQTCRAQARPARDRAAAAAAAPRSARGGAGATTAASVETLKASPLMGEVWWGWLHPQAQSGSPSPPLPTLPIKGRA